MTSDRRRFLRFLAASPLAARAWAQDPDLIITRPKDALRVMDFEPAARKALPPAHWGYMATGVDDDKTLRANREAFDHYQLRARRLVDVTHANLKTEVFGATWDTPIYISAVGSQKAFHPEGEIATARAARTRNTMQMLSTVTSVPVEEVGKALGTAPWYQLYMPVNWEDTEKMVKRAEAAGCPVLRWDLLGEEMHQSRVIVGVVNLLPQHRFSSSMAPVRNLEARLDVENPHSRGRPG